MSEGQCRPRYTRLKPTRVANAIAALPARHRYRKATRPARANAREACPLGSEGSGSVAQPYPGRVRAPNVGSTQGRERSTRYLIAVVTTTVRTRMRTKSNVASRCPRNHKGIAKRARMYVPPSAVMRTMTRSKVALVPARLIARKRSSSTPPIEANIGTGFMRPDSQRPLKFRSTTDNPQTFHRPGRRPMNRAQQVYQRLLQYYGPQHWWPAETAFEAIVGALLMQQTSWRTVEVAIRNLRRAGLLDVRALADAPVPVIRRHVRIAGLYRTKPARVRAFCRHLLDRSDGDLALYFDRPMEELRADLLAQDGVGPETADSILLYAGGHPVFVVDAYTVRIGRRIGWFDTDAYETVQLQFEAHLPRDLAVYREYHALLVAHAKAVCRPTPRCDECPVRTR